MKTYKCKVQWRESYVIVERIDRHTGVAIYRRYYDTSLVSNASLTRLAYILHNSFKGFKAYPRILDNRHIRRYNALTVQVCRQLLAS